MKKSTFLFSIFASLFLLQETSGASHCSEQTSVSSPQVHNSHLFPDSEDINILGEILSSQEEDPYQLLKMATDVTPTATLSGRLLKHKIEELEKSKGENEN